jgi:hypothetical protein
MVRTSLSVHARLMRVQALRQKREAIEGAATEDAWALHIAERSMLRVVDPDAEPQAPAWPEPAAATWPEPPAATLPEPAPAACGDQRTADNVSENGINSQGVAFETRLSEQPWNRGSRGSGETGLCEVVREAMAKSRLADRESLANGRESPGRAN